MALTLSRTLYDALIAASIAHDDTEILRLRDLIDAENDITRYLLWVRWQETGGPTPPRVDIWAGWPPSQTEKIEIERRITREDVDAVLNNKAINPVGVQVTADPLATVGWFLLDSYDFDV